MTLVAQGTGPRAAAPSSVHGRSLWQLSKIAFVTGAVLRLALVLVVQSLHGNFLFLDDQGYDHIGWSLAQAWSNHTFPSPASYQYAGSLNYLYYVFVAIVYFVLGHHWVLVKAVAAVLSALSAPAAAAVGDALGGRRLAARAAWLAALYPNAIFWGATGLKDGPLTTLLLVTVAIALRPLTMRRLVAATAIIAVGFLTRPVLGIICLAMLAIPIAQLAHGRLHGTSTRTGTRTAVVFVGLPVLAVVSVSLAFQYVHLVKSILAGDAGLSLGNEPVTVSFTPSATAILRSLLGPFPWSFGPATDNVYRSLYPGMILWIILLPVAILGSWELIRRGSWAAKGVVVSALVYLYLYTVVFHSQGFFRQRYTVEILLLVVGLYAFAKRPQWSLTLTAIGACVTAIAALVQAKVLPPLGLVLLLLAVPSLYVRGEIRPLAFARDVVLALYWPRGKDRERLCMGRRNWRFSAVTHTIIRIRS